MAEKNGNRRNRVDPIKHKDKRKNIPTEELRDFAVGANHDSPLLYPRDPSLDPQYDRAAAFRLTSYVLLAEERTRQWKPSW